MVIIQILGSLYFAVSLIAGLALMLTVSTLLESFYGTPFVQRYFYQTGWFNAFLGLLAVNILFSALSRFPYKKRHTGFVMTHAGILLLLIGSLMTSLMGIDGQMMLFEGEKKDSIVQTTYELIVRETQGKIIPFPLRTGNREIKHHLNTSAGSIDLTIRRVWDNAVVKTDIINSPSGAMNHAAQLALSSQRTGVNENMWLVENNPLDPNSNHFTMGPAMFQIGEKPKVNQEAQNSEKKSESPKLHLHNQDSSLDLSVNLQDIPQGDIALGQGGLKVSNLKYYPEARVGENNKLVNASDQANNPAVEFDITDPNGETQHFIKFALYPDFESMHAASKKIFDLTVELTAPAAGSSSNPNSGPSLSIYYTADGSWVYVSKSSAGVSEGPVKTGQTYQTGWMDFSFRVENLFDHATVIKHVDKAPISGKGQIAAEVSIAQNNQTIFNNWVLENETQALEAGSNQMLLSLQARNHKVPFSLQLKEFRKVDYPGTHQPSSFESDVTLVDPEENLTLNRTISMNKPLDYKGYRIFQSSYVEDDPSGKASIFTVAKNPGIIFIYGGAIVIFLGSFLVFFVPPFSSMLREGKS